MKSNSLKTDIQLLFNLRLFRVCYWNQCIEQSSLQLILANYEQLAVSLRRAYIN